MAGCMSSSAWLCGTNNRNDCVRSEINAFHGEQPFLPIQSAAKTANLFIRRQDAVAGDKQWYRV